jgi:putative ABC transport system substrate-binding protein
MQFSKRREFISLVGGMTGTNQIVERLATKNLRLLYGLVQQTQIIAMLVDPNFTPTESIVRNAETAIHRLGCKLQVLTASSDQDVDKVFMILALQHIRALFVAPAPFFYNRRDRIIELAARHGIPTLYVRREFVAGGGLELRQQCLHTYR